MQPRQTALMLEIRRAVSRPVILVFRSACRISSARMAVHEQTPLDAEVSTSFVKETR